MLECFRRKNQLNRQTNQTLEAMAQALFKSWFVDFDPVIDNALAAGHEIPEPLQARAEQRKALLAGDVSDDASPERVQPLPASIRQLFPNRFVRDAEKGWIPEGWERKSIGSILDLAYGKSLPAKDRVPGPFPVYGSGGVSGFHSSPLCRAPGVVVGRKGTVGSVYWVSSDFYPIDTVFFVKLKEELPLYWVYKKLTYMDIASLSADSAVPGVNRNAILSMNWVIPTEQVLNEYLSLVESNITQVSQLNDQNESLTKLRDTLLPKLISGELRLPETQKLMEETV